MEAVVGLARWLSHRTSWRGQRMVLVMVAGGVHRWSWLAPSRKAARGATAALADALATGAWVPGRMTPPDLPGTTAYEG